MVTSHQHVAHFTFCRLLRVGAAFRWRQIFRRAPHAPLTFCIAHFNSPEFLDVTLHTVRRFHPEARVIVADAPANTGTLKFDLK
ncbi:MAG: hypothetical protein ABSE97_06625 [Verrucomicrobiota bacterium]|jgi:hypothetical protein